MSNWNDNQLKVEGNKGSLEKFKNSLIEINERGMMDITLEKLYPTPPDLLQMSSPVKYNGNPNDLVEIKIWEKYCLFLKLKNDGHCDWYDWRYEKWGVGRDCWIDYGHWEKFDFGENYFILNFTSHWNPPVNFFINASEIFFDLKFRLSFYDTVNEDYGAFEISNGEWNKVELAVQLVDENKEPVYQDESGDWYYSSTNLKITRHNFRPHEFVPDLFVY